VGIKVTWLTFRITDTEAITIREADCRQGLEVTVVQGK